MGQGRAGGVRGPGKQRRTVAVAERRTVAVAEASVIMPN